MQKQIKLIATLIIPVIILTLIVTSILSLTQFNINLFGYEIINLLYWISVPSLLILIYYYKNNMFPGILISLTIFLVIQLSNMYFNSNYFSSDRALRITLFIVLVSSLFYVRWNKNLLKVISYTLLTIVFGLTVKWVIDDFPQSKYQSIFRNQNHLNIMLFLMSYFFILSIRYFNVKSKVLYVFIMINVFLLIYSTDSRSVYLIGVVLAGSYLILKLIPRIYKYLFPLIILGSIYLFFVALNKNPYPLIIKLDTLTSQNFFNGREKIWDTIYNEAVKDVLYFGHGYGVSASHVANTHQSTHNVYLQVVLESGLVGLFAFLIILFFIWRLLLQNLNTFAGRLSSTYFLAILVYINFELIFFPNTLVTIAIFMWLTITFGISFDEKSKESEPS